MTSNAARDHAAAHAATPSSIAAAGSAVAGDVREGATLAIETRGLSKRFGPHAAVDDIDLRVPTGSVFGFLGPNGSGKTTTIRMLLGLANATSGQISVLGEAMPSGLASVLPRVGALVEGPGFYPFLSGAANLHRLDTADIRAPSATRSARVKDALDRVGLSTAASKKVRAYSLGMKQRLGIANALLSPRELLVLDEPTNGLDPQGTREVRSLVKSLAAEGTTIFVSSHLLAEIEQMCTHAAVMSAGRLVAQGTLAQLRGEGRPRVLLTTPDATRASRVLRELGMSTDPHVSNPVGDGQPSVVLTAFFESDAIAPDLIVAALVNDGVRVTGFTLEQPTLEDRFVALTGEGFEVAT